MSIEKKLWEPFYKTKGLLNDEEMCNLLIAETAIGYQRKNKLREIVTSNDLITNRILDEVKDLPISDASKNLFIEHLETIFEKIHLSVVVDSSLHIAKLLEEYEAIEILNTIISKLSKLKTASFLIVPDELMTVIREYFEMPSGSTLHSGVVGIGSEIMKLIGNRDDITFYGQDFAKEQLMLAEIQFMFSPFKYEIKFGDELKTPLYIEGDKLKQFDYVFNAPRFGLRLDSIAMKAIEENRYNRFTRFGPPSKNNGDLAYVICGLEQLEDTGKGAFILPASVLTRSGSDSIIRDRFLEFDLIDVIIELPTGIFAPISGISTVLILFNKNKPSKAKGNIQFINASTFGERDRMKTTIREDEIKTLLDLIEQRNEISGISIVLANQQVEDFQLLPSKYVFNTSIELEDYGRVEIHLNTFDEVDSVELSNIAEIYRGYNALPKDQSEDGNYAIIKIADIEDGEIHYDSLTKYQLGGRIKVDNYRLEKGDIILPVRGSLLKVAVFESDREDVLLSQNFVGIRLNKDYDPYFVKLYIESPIMQFLLRSKLTGTTVMNLPMKEVESLPIPKIPLEQQQRIVATYQEKSDALKEKIAQLKKELDSVKLKSFEEMGIGGTFTIKK